MLQLDKHKTNKKHHGNPCRWYFQQWGIWPNTKTDFLISAFCYNTSIFLWPPKHEQANPQTLTGSPCDRILMLYIHKLMRQIKLFRCHTAFQRRWRKKAEWLRVCLNECHFCFHAFCTRNKVLTLCESFNPIKTQALALYGTSLSNSCHLMSA